MLSTKSLIIYLIELTESSFPGIGIVAKLGSQFVSRIEIMGILRESASLLAIISLF